MKHGLVRLTVSALMPVWLLGCNANGVAPRGATPSAGTISMTTVAPDQTRICEVNKWQKDVTAAACTAGQKVVFLPDSWGNEQLPILFAAVNCDLRYAVALTNGGVTCIYAGPLAPEHHDASPAPTASTAPHPAPLH
ncbi:hypothetical protein ABQJ54_18795 [Rhodanobacter sp. Si-c]|uniref:Lipoprotein n=1 Tax=Rhodanobacter lycopersici TaxID=3162487 RepID=A0ABV3QIY3_9GAMM